MLLEHDKVHHKTKHTYSITNLLVMMMDNQINDVSINMLVDEKKDKEKHDPLLTESGRHWSKIASDSRFSDDPTPTAPPPWLQCLTQSSFFSEGWASVGFLLRQMNKNCKCCPLWLNIEGLHQRRLKLLFSIVPWFVLWCCSQNFFVFVFIIIFITCHKSLAMVVFFKSDTRSGRQWVSEKVVTYSAVLGQLKL